MIACPKQLIGKNDLRHAYPGMKLPERGRETGDWLSLDWKSGPGIMVAAAANSGKSVVINTLIAAALEAGFQLRHLRRRGQKRRFPMVPAVDHPLRLGLR